MSLFIFTEVNFVLLESSPADSLRHQVLFLHYFWISWLGNWFMNDIQADIFNGLTPMVLSCCLASFYKRAGKSCFAHEMSSLKSLQSPIDKSFVSTCVSVNEKLFVILLSGGQFLSPINICAKSKFSQFIY